MIAIFLPVFNTASGNQLRRKIYYTFATTATLHELDYANSLSKTTRIDSSVIRAVVHQEVNGFGINSFQLEIVNSQDEYGLSWEEKVYVGDIVIIGMRREHYLYPYSLDPYEYTVTMVGIVNNITKQTVMQGDVENPAADRKLIISGLDITGLFNNHYMYSNTTSIGALQQLRDRGVISAYVGINELLFKLGDQAVAVEVHEVIRTYIQEIFCPDFMYAVAGSPNAEEGLVKLKGRALGEMFIIDNNSQSFSLGGKSLPIYGLQYYNFIGSGSQFVHQVLQKPFNEIIITYPKIYASFSGGSIYLEVNPYCNILVRPAPFNCDPNYPVVTGSGGDALLKPEFGTLLGSSPVFSSLTKNNIHEVYDEEVVQESLGFNNEVPYNLFFVDAQTQGAIGMHLLHIQEPVCDLDHIRRHGLNPLIKQYDYIQIIALPNQEESKSEEQSTSAIVNNQRLDKPEAIEKAIYNTSQAIAVPLTNVLKQWFVKCNEFLIGTVTVRGNPQIKPGDVLYYNPYDVYNKDGALLAGNRRFIFYVESVIHEFVNFSHFFTTIKLGRGVEVPD
jgi:hypothetical protein